jgi:hypothetical protein
MVNVQDSACKAMERSQPVIASDLERQAPSWWFGRPLIIAALIVALFGSITAKLMLIRLAWPRTYHIHMVTDLVPRRKLLAEQIRAEGSRHRLDLVFSAKHFGALEALGEVDSPNENKLGLARGYLGCMRCDPLRHFGWSPGEGPRS